MIKLTFIHSLGFTVEDTAVVRIPNSVDIAVIAGLKKESCFVQDLCIFAYVVKANFHSLGEA